MISIVVFLSDGPARVFPWLLMLGGAILLNLASRRCESYVIRQCIRHSLYQHGEIPETFDD